MKRRHVSNVYAMVSALSASVEVVTETHHERRDHHLSAGDNKRPRRGVEAGGIDHRTLHWQILWRAAPGGSPLLMPWLGMHTPCGRGLRGSGTR
jgi:hypothetical protein